MAAGYWADGDGGISTTARCTSCGACAADSGASKRGDTIDAEDEDDDAVEGADALGAWKRYKTLFDGTGGEVAATITRIDKRGVGASLGRFRPGSPAGGGGG